MALLNKFYLTNANLKVPASTLYRRKRKRKQYQLNNLDINIHGTINVSHIQISSIKNK